MVRPPAVAGLFYPGNAHILKDLIESFIRVNPDKKKALCVISPHAGYEYSGRVAGAVFSSVNIPDRCIVLGPSHRAFHRSFALMRIGEWETPLGKVSTDTEIADALLETSTVFEENESPHLEEHSIEVQLPFLQFFNPAVRFVPISVGTDMGYSALEEMGKALARAVKKISGEVLLVASTDMSHYVSRATAEEKDGMAIERILNLDPQGLYKIVVGENISMCGFQPTAAAVAAAKEMGAKKAELIDYGTSGDVSGDISHVVGYAGLRII